MEEIKINKGIELMLRGTKPKSIEPTRKGILINKVFTLLKRKVYFNFELRWEKKKISSELNND
jgi:hypothetical protein|tara:strand:- start:3072 stop:3260 length:189 start_codon:yes stop_codon:yes gene_type:complete